MSRIPRLNCTLISNHKCLLSEPLHLACFCYTARANRDTSLLFIFSPHSPPCTLILLYPKLVHTPWVTHCHVSLLLSCYTFHPESPFLFPILWKPTLHLRSSSNILLWFMRCFLKMGVEVSKLSKTQSTFNQLTGEDKAKKPRAHVTFSLLSLTPVGRLQSFSFLPKHSHSSITILPTLWCQP